MTEKIVVEKRGHVLMIGLNRVDKLNSFDPEMLMLLAKAYTQLAKDRELRCGVLWAKGNDFTTGLDMTAIAKHIPKSIIKPTVPRGCIDPLGIKTKPCPKPIISAVQGRCFTIGLDLILANQITIAASNIRFIQSEVSRGLMPLGGSTVRFPSAVGTKNAYRYLLTGDEINADEALRLGLVQEVVEPEECLSRAIKLAEHIAMQAPLGIMGILRNVRHSQNRGHKSALSKLKYHAIRLFMSKDLRLGIKSFKERKPVNFVGR